MVWHYSGAYFIPRTGLLFVLYTLHDRICIPELDTKHDMYFYVFINTCTIEFLQLGSEHFLHDSEYFGMSSRGRSYDTLVVG